MTGSSESVLANARLSSASTAQTSKDGKKISKIHCRKYFHDAKALLNVRGTLVLI